MWGVDHCWLTIPILFPIYYFWEHVEELFKNFANMVETLRKDKNPKSFKNQLSNHPQE
jgi:hypothetical protein